MVNSSLDIRENLAHWVHITQNTVLEHETSHSLIIIVPYKILGKQQRTWWGFVDLLQQLEKYFLSLGKLGPCPLPPMWMSSTQLVRAKIVGIFLKSTSGKDVAFFRAGLFVQL